MTRRSLRETLSLVRRGGKLYVASVVARNFIAVPSGGGNVITVEALPTWASIGSNRVCGRSVEERRFSAAIASRMNTGFSPRRSRGKVAVRQTRDLIQLLSG